MGLKSLSSMVTPADCVDIDALALVEEMNTLKVSLLSTLESSMVLMETDFRVSPLLKDKTELIEV